MSLRAFFAKQSPRQNWGIASFAGTLARNDILILRIAEKQPGSLKIAVIFPPIRLQSKKSVAAQGFAISTSDSEEKSALRWEDFHPDGHMSLRSK